MAFKNIKGSTRNSLLDYAVSGKAVQYHSAESGLREVLYQGLTATGGIINDYVVGSDVYRAHTFTSSGTFDVSEIGNLGDTVDYLLVGGGGGGGNSNGGGGGAGAVHYRTSQVISTSPGSYVINIGGGGVGEVYDNTVHENSTGTSSSIPGFSITASGGGAGGNGAGPGPWSPGVTGASGGGGATNSGSPGAGTGNAYPGSGPLVSPANGWGNDGGTGSPPVGLGAGGGGAGGGGRPHNDGDFRAAGGAGILIPGPTMSGYDLKIAGGGGGGGPFPGGTSGGGSQDAGDSVQYGGAPTTKGASPSPGGTGTFATGGGGGGGGGQPVSQGGNGGSGLAVIRYKIGTQETSTAKATGGNVSFYNGKTIHTFTSSGTFTTLSNWSATNVEYVVIGGGGSGGIRYFLAGGGGAGSYRTGTTPIGAHPVSTTIQIGAGGASSLDPAPVPSARLDGSSSYFGTPITAPGGGGGGYYNGVTGFPGGSGGGGGAIGSGGGPATGAPFPGTIGATPPAGWGHNGGTGSDTPYYGSGGGGGAGGAGVSGIPTLGGNGGVGIQLPSTFRDPKSSVGAPGPTSPSVTGADNSGKFYVAGGGGGSTYQVPSPGSSGGAGGGGNGAAGGRGQHAVNNTGSGGGGNEREVSPYPNQSGQGGSGLVLIAYPS